MHGADHLSGWSLEALIGARLYDLTAAVWLEKKHRPEPLTPKAPPKPSHNHDPRSIEALKAFMS